MPIKYHLTLEKLLEFPVLREYKYLGVEIDNKGNIKNHFEKIVPKINFLNYKLQFVSWKMDFQ